jgi:Tol biopolymer transport system component
LPPHPTQPQRRSADRLGSNPDREGALRILFLGILVAVVGGFGWWYWRYATGHGLVHDSSPNWAPDSLQVVFASLEGGQTDVYITDLTGRRRQRITTAGNEGSPAFSPSGTLIAFDSDRDGNSEIYVMRANGDAPQRLTENAARDLGPSWSPDGRFIVFMSDRDNKDFDVYRMEADGKNVERLTTGGGSFPQCSPDGAQIAYQSGRDVYVLSLKTRTSRRVTHEPLNGMYPTWSSDGSQIAFMSWRNGRTELFTAKSSGIEQTLLVSMPLGDAVDPRWSPDGKHIAFVNMPEGGASSTETRNRQRIVYVVNVQTNRVTRLSR